MPCHTKEIFQRNEVLTIQNLVAKNCLVAMHKVYLNVSPPCILELFTIVNEHRPRRDPVYFTTPYGRLMSQDKILEFKGPRTYNNVVNTINSKNSEAGSKIQLEKLFLTRFKKEVVRYLLNKQSFGDVDWLPENFVL